MQFGAPIHASLAAASSGGARPGRAVPWDRLDVDAQRQAAILDVTEQQLHQARNFDYRGTWPAKVDWPFGGDK